MNTKFKKFLLKEGFIKENEMDGPPGGDWEDDDGLGEDDIFAGKRLPPEDEAELEGMDPAKAISQFLSSFEQNQFGDSVWQGNMKTLRQEVINVAVACKHMIGD